MKELFDVSTAELYKQIIEHTFEATVLHIDYKIIYANDGAAKILGARKEDIIGSEIIDIIPEKSKLLMRERARRVQEENQIGDLIETTINTVDGKKIDVEVYCHPFVHDGENSVLTVFRDISARKEMEMDFRKKINEISTPIVRLIDGISIIPLVGEIDEEKAQILIDTLPIRLGNISDTKYIIIDFTGIYNIDEVVIDFLYTIHSIMSLLGIEPILTGIRPELARKVILLAGNFSITTLQSVKKALVYIRKKINSNEAT